MIFQTSIYDGPIVSTKDKEKNDYERIKEIAEGILATDRGPDEKLKMQICLQAHNGSIDPILYEDPYCIDVKENNGTLTQLQFDHQNISHTPWTATFVNAFEGEQIAKRFSIGVVDNRSNRDSIYRRQLEKPITEHFTNIVNSVRQLVTEQVTQGSNPQQLQDPRVQQQLQQQVSKLLENQIPKTILDHLSGNYTAPIPKLAKATLEHHIKKDDIRYKTQSEAVKFAVCHDEVYYFAGEWGGRLDFRVENPMNIVSGCGVRTEVRIEYADWVKRTDFVSLTQALSMHSDTLTRSEIKDLEEGFANYKSNGSRATQPFWGDNQRTKEFMKRVSDLPKAEREQFAGYDRHTPEGQNKFLQMYTRVMGGNGWGSRYADCGIQQDHICVRLPMKMYRIKRKNEEGREYWVERMEHYEPVHTDIEVHEIRREGIYEMFVLNREIITGIRPLPCQYSSPENYRRPTMPYYGQRLSTHQNTVKGKSMIERALPAQKMYDTTLASIKKDLATDIGPVFMMFMNLKPEDWKYQDWLDFMINAGIMWIDPKNRAMNNVDPQFLKQINLSKMGAIAAKLSMLDRWKSNIAMALFYSEQRAEAPGQYATDSNIEASNERLYHKTAPFVETLRKITERAVTGYMNRCVYYYRDHIEEASTFLNDVQLQLLKSIPISSFEYLGIEFERTDEQDKKAARIQQFVIGTGAQSGMDPLDSIEILCTDDIGEIRDITKASVAKRQQAAVAARQEESNLEQQKIQSEAKDKELDRQLKLLIQSRDLSSKERRSEVESTRFAQQQDIDGNKQSDLLEGTLRKIQIDKQISDDKLVVEREKLALKEKLSEAPRI